MIDKVDILDVIPAGTLTWEVFWRPANGSVEQLSVVELVRYGGARGAGAVEWDATVSPSRGPDVDFEVTEAAIRAQAALDDEDRAS